MSDRFTLNAPISAWEKAGDKYPLRIGGIVSTDKLDRQNEKVVQDGLDFDPFLSHGWFNDNHGQKTTDVLGYPSEVVRVKPGQTLPNGQRSEVNGWWAEGYLLNTDNGRKLWNMAHSLEGNEDRQLGFSIEGKVGQRNHNKKHPEVATATVKNVAITHQPINDDTGMHALAKSLAGGGAAAGSAINPPTSAVAGDAFALRAESLEGSPFDQSYGKTDEDEDDQVPGFKLIVMKADDNSEEEAPAEPTGVEFVDHWADATADFLGTPVVDSLTKAEATIIVAHRLPHLSRSQIEAVVASAGGGA